MQNCITIGKEGQSNGYREHNVAGTGDSPEGNLPARWDKTRREIGDRALAGWRVPGRAVRKKGSISDFAGCLKGKTNGTKLTIEEMDEAIGQAVVEEFLRGVQR